MSVRITWQPSSDVDIASYDLEHAPSIGGPWSLLANVPHSIPGANWDVDEAVFFFLNTVGGSTSYYRLTAIGIDGQRSSVSSPFQAAGAAPGNVPGLVGVVSITVGDVSALLSLGFTVIEMWHSIDEGGVWAEVTAPTSSPATATSLVALTSFRIGGETLRLKLSGGGEQGVVFDDILLDWTAAQVASKVNETVAGLASVVSGSVILQTAETGRQSSLEVVSTPAALAFPVGVSYGKDVRLALVDGALIYTFYDTASTETSRYRWRFSNNGAEPISRFSKYVLPRSTAVSGVALSVGTARFVGMDGRPRRGKLILAILSMPGQGAMLSSDTEVVEADEQGFAQVQLVVGALIKVALEGTGFVREFIVPNQPTFDILAVAGTTTNLFTPQVVPPLLTRRSV